MTKLKKKSELIFVEAQNLSWCFFHHFTIPTKKICPVVPDARCLSWFRSERRMGTELV